MLYEIAMMLSRVLPVQEVPLELLAQMEQEYDCFVYSLYGRCNFLVISQ